MTYIVAAILFVVLGAVALVGKRRSLKLAAVIGLLLVCLSLGTLVALVYSDPSAL